MLMSRTSCLFIDIIIAQLLKIHKEVLFERRMSFIPRVQIFSFYLDFLVRKNLFGHLVRLRIF